MRVSTFSALSFCFSALALAQDLSIPSTWIGRNSTLRRNERIQNAQAAINTVKPLWVNNPNNGLAGTIPGWAFWNSGRVLQNMVFKDLVAGTTDNRNVTDMLRMVARTNPFFQRSDRQIKSPIIWAETAILAHKAYQDSSMLELAQTVWANVSAYQITGSTASSGKIPDKNSTFTFNGSCHGRSIAGMLFLVMEPDAWGLFSSQVMQFASLSVRLYEATKEHKYLDAAVSAVTAIRDSLLDSDKLIISHLDPGIAPVGSGNMGDCQLYPDTKTTEDTGMWIQALAMVADATGDPQWTELMKDSLAAAVSTPIWTRFDGLVTENSEPSRNDDDASYKGRFLRALYEPWVRSNSTEVRNLIEAFINVQTTSLLNSATTGNSNFYSANWAGPPATAFSSAGALAGLEVLAAAIGPSSSSTTSADGPSPTQPLFNSSAPSTSKKVNLGLILGVTFGSLGLVAAIIVIFCYRRRRQTLRHSDKRQLDLEKEYPRPFHSTASLPTSRKGLIATSRSVIATPSPVHSRASSVSFRESDLITQVMLPPPITKSKRFTVSSLDEAGPSVPAVPAPADVTTEGLQRPGLTWDGSAPRPSSSTEGKPRSPNHSRTSSDEPVSTANPDPSAALSTDQLVSMLNARLQSGPTRDSNLAPPLYHE